MTETTKIINIHCNFDTIKEMFKIININIDTINDIEHLEIDRNDLLTDDIKLKFLDLIKPFKKKYSSSKLTSLHNNSNIRQKFPQINLLRQILKCNNYKLTPKVTSIGYTSTGKKIIKRSYMITKY